ncbi:MAG: efflux RND transporter periplasmic adaptor subunit [Bacteroidales bacterium]|nr:efflux RND transporter periplasmic adaptor subunit [Bacteroidales bacterium]MBQ9722885.1 efflux RND transporter periplasmic adaptor subunit [Bacteroidales bacterium]
MKTIFRTMFLAGALVAVAGCGNNEKNTETVKVVDDTPTVSVVQVGVQNVPQDVTYTSTVQPFVKNNIVPQGGNRIKKINVEVGDFVKQGQVLAEMDMTQLQQAELQLVNNEIEYNRLKTLYEAGGLSKSDLDAIEMAYKVSRTTYENLLENAILTSPIDGVITARNYDVGDMYAMSAPLFTVEQIKPVKLLVAVSESDYSKVKKGDSVEVTADAVPGKTFYGKVTRIYPTVDPATRTVTVEVQVANNYSTLRPGMFTRVKLNFGTNRSVVVPDVAVVKQQGSGERFIYVLNDDGTVTYQPVVLGRRLGAEYEVLDGIKDGAKVVTGGQLRLKDGVKVVVK